MLCEDTQQQLWSQVRCECVNLRSQWLCSVKSPTVGLCVSRMNTIDELV